MTIDIDDLLNSIMGTLDRVSFVKSQEVPKINLYMDQVTTFMEEHLKNTTRHKEEDKILTKTMINNYAKNNLLPPPEKKKYSKEHILVLIFIYYFKNIISINDIQTILNPLTDQFFGKDGFSITDIYDEVTTISEEQIDLMKQDIRIKYETATSQFKDSPKKDQEFLQMFSFICMLSFDVYFKKLLLESILDQYTEKKEREEEKNFEKRRNADGKSAEKRKL